MATTTWSPGTYSPGERITFHKGLFQGPPVSIRWGAVFAGAVTALGLWLLLYTLGLALGLTAVTPANPDSAEGAGIFTGIWGAVSPLVALLIGAFIAARSSGVLDRGSGAVAGLVMWGLAMVLGAFLVGSAFSSLLGGVGSVGKAALQAGGVAAQDKGQSKPGQILGIDANQVIAPINDRLQAEGKPPVTADQLGAAIKDATRQGLAQGKLDRQVLVSSLSQNTNLSEADANDLADRVEQQGNQTKNDLTRAGLKAADTTGKVFWGVFAALLLGLISSLIGGSLGASGKGEARQVAGSR
jgi:hypothetical protein